MQLWDSGDREPTSTLGHWLNTRLPGATAFDLQTAYYSDGALFHVEEYLREILEGGGSFRLVIGGNQAAARVADIEILLDFMEPHAAAQAIVVYPEVGRLLVHSKAYHVSHPGGDSAWVGSANFTAFGVANNVELGVSFSGEAEADVVREVAEHTEALFDSGHPLNGNIIPLSRATLPLLSARGVLVRGQSKDSVGGSGKKGGQGPSIPFLDPPRRPSPSKGKGAGKQGKGGAVGVVSAASGGMAGTPHPALPPGVVATVKTLGKTDVKGIKEQSGTWYLSFGLPYQGFFPQKVGAVPADPRIETVVEARLCSQPMDSVTTAPGDTTSITLEGAAAGTKTNLNTRVNLSKHLASEFRAMAARHTEALPEPGDLVVAEYLDNSPVVVRLTFVRQSDPQYAPLASHVGQGSGAGNFGRPPNGYGWLSASDVSALLPPW
ncbi:phospholipase D family protein [Serinicoccus sp. CNJ-927]|uniref:phospholipase D family protein n=1 Tax=Serinicoccus sp. CNJ-927 TaxID=1904970 RepID=UPI001301417E|nr:phospholipase D family protein [Serinicoccus sp. CNJ-927]